MTNLALLPIQLISAPNVYCALNTTYWPITGGVAIVLAGLLQQTDTLGTRPYVPAVGATLMAVFQRGDGIGQVPNPPSGFPFNISPGQPMGPGYPLYPPPAQNGLQPSPSNQQTVVRQATLDTNFRALATVALTQQDNSAVISGTILFTLTEGTTVNQWSQAWSAKKINTAPGC